MKVLLTGAGGVIGRHSAAALDAVGIEVHAAGRSQLRPSHLHPPIVWHRFDLLREDPGMLVEKVAPDAILHLAWVTRHGAFRFSPDNLDWVASSLKLLRAFAEKGGRRFVSAGTCAEYDWLHLGDGICREEITAIGSAALYGIAKNSFRQCAESYCRATNLSFAWGRIFYLFGEGEAQERLFPSLMSALSCNRPAAVSHGRQVRDIASSRDIGIAFAKLLLSLAEGVFNVASGRPITIREFALAVAARADGEIDFGGALAKADEPPVLVADVSRLRSAIGFVPGQDLNAEIHRLVDAYQR